MNRKLDGIFIRVGKENICLSDMKEEDRLIWLSGLRQDELVRTVNILANTLKDIGDKFNLSRMSDDNDD